jgi:hypothetical protein
MTTCPSCGYENVDDRDFCRECGVYLRWDEPTEVRDAPAPPPVSETPTTTLPVSEPEPEPVRVAPTPEPAVLPSDPVQVTLKQPDGGSAGGPVVVRVEPGGEVALVAVVRNQSGIVDNYDMNVVGWPETWWTVSPQTVHLLPSGDESDQEVVVRLHPPRAPEAEARPWAVKVAATSRVERAAVAAAPATVEVAPYEQFELRIRPERARGEGSAEYAIPVRNLGNAPLALTFTGEDAEGEVRFDFSPSLLDVPLGAEARATLRVSAPRPRKGPERERRLTVMAESDRSTQTLPATFVQAPPPPVVTEGRVLSWRWLIALVAAFLIAIGSFMAWTGDGANGICTSAADATAGQCLRYDVFAERFLDEPNVDAPSSGRFLGFFSFAASVGIVTLLVSLIVLLGVRTGAAAWFGGIVTILLLIVYLVIAGDSGAGVWVAMLGGVLAIVAGLLATTRARSG